VAGDPGMRDDQPRSQCAVHRRPPRFPKPVGGPAWLKTQRTVEHSATSTALYVGSVQLEVSGS